MGIVYWTGNAIPVSQVDTFTVTYGSGSAPTISITIGQAVITIVGATDSPTTANLLVAALQGSNSPQFLEVDWEVSGAVITGTAKLPGVPFTATCGHSGGTSANFVQAHPVVNSGPNDAKCLPNYSGGVYPTDLDILEFLPGTPSMLWNLRVDDFYTTMPMGINIPAGFTNTIGLPVWNLSGGGYFEYRPTCLNFTNAIINIGYGPGAGSSRIRLTSVTADVSQLTIYNTGAPADPGFGSVFIDGTVGGLGGSTFGVEVLRGNVYLGDNFTGPVSFGYVTNVNSDVVVNTALGFCSPIYMTGGTVSTYVPVNQPIVIVQSGGSLTINGSGWLHQATLGSTQNKTTTTLNNLGGMISAAEATGLSLPAPFLINGPQNKLDFSGENTPKDLETIVIQRSPGSTLNDPSGNATNYKMKFVNCSPDDCTTTLKENATLPVTYV